MVQCATVCQQCVGQAWEYLVYYLPDRYREVLKECTRANTPVPSTARVTSVIKSRLFIIIRLYMDSIYLLSCCTGVHVM